MNDPPKRMWQMGTPPHQCELCGPGFEAHPLFMVAVMHTLHTDGKAAAEAKIDKLMQGYHNNGHT